MQKVTVSEFNVVVSQNEELAKKLTVLQQKYSDELTALAAEHGYALEIQSVNDEQLAAVVGGTSVYPGSYGTGGRN